VATRRAIDVGPQRGEGRFDFVGDPVDALTPLGVQHEARGQRKQRERIALVGSTTHAFHARRALVEPRVGLSVEDRALD
jgi:hypothetical protein